jgi:short-subunit dehydrogenase
MSDQTVLITGASAGIGTAFANEFAKHGFNVVLVARRLDRLNQIAEQLQGDHNVEVHVLQEDLSEKDAASRVVKSLKDRRIVINALVNNAGYALNGGFLESSWEEHLAMHQVMLTGYTELCYRLLPGMVEQGYGRIINISSMAAFLPSSRSSMYTGIKRYVVDLSLAIDFELREKGIHCCAVCPGFTYTEFHDVLGVREQASNYPKIMWQSAEQVAKEGFEAVMAGRVVLINGWANRLLASLIGILPRAVQYRIARNQIPFED